MFRVPHALVNINPLDVPGLFFFLSSGMHFSSLCFSLVIPLLYSILFSIILSFVSSLLYSLSFSCYDLYFLYTEIVLCVSYVFPMCPGVYFIVLHPLVHISLYLLLFHSNHLYLLCILIHILFISSVCYRSIYLICIRIFPLLHIYILVFPLQ